MPQTLANGCVVLTFSLGINTSTKKPRWQARANGVLHVPHYDGATPTESGQAWECRPLDQIGPASRRGSGVVVVWLIEPHVSATQQRRAGLEAHRQRLALA